MLQNMHIKNIALIDEIDVEFEDGLNILTGETGAGKSIIIGSLGICLGGKFNKELLRDSDSDGLVELTFFVNQEHIKDKLLEFEIPFSDGELVISRRLSSSGRTVNRVNDTTVTTARLKEIAALLIDLHAQHEQQTLLKADKHLAILDHFGGNDIADKKALVRALYTEYTDIKKELETNSMDEAEKNKRMDFLDYQIKEIKASDLKTGEDEALENSYKKALNSKEILSIMDEIYSMTGYDNNDSVGEIIGHLVQQLAKASEMDEDLRGSYDMLQDIDGMLNDFNREISHYMEDMTFDEQSFSEIEDRLNLINSLKLKYGRTIEDILHTCDEYEEEYNKLVSYDEYRTELKKKLKLIEEKLDMASFKLTESRKSAAQKLTEMLKASLMELNFMTVMFEMKFEQNDHYTANGRDIAYFMISTNVGEPMRPLYEVASGGELSRVMLALKSSLAYEDDTPTLVFDEIDVGISGRTAQKVAEKMAVISKNHQVICITHLPQIAAMADTHYIIEKNVENNKTISSIKRLSDEEEVIEIARLLGGVEITDNTIANAREMKGLAERTKIY